MPLYAYITDPKSRQPYPKGWVGYFDGIILYENPLTANQINANMFTETKPATDSEAVAKVYERLSAIQRLNIKDILGGDL